MPYNGWIRPTKPKRQQQSTSGGSWMGTAFPAGVPFPGGGGSGGGMTPEQLRRITQMGGGGSWSGSPVTQQPGQGSWLGGARTDPRTIDWTQHPGIAESLWGGGPMPDIFGNAPLPNVLSGGEGPGGPPNTINPPIMYPLGEKSLGGGVLPGGIAELLGQGPAKQRQGPPGGIGEDPIMGYWPLPKSNLPPDYGPGRDPITGLPYDTPPTTEPDPWTQFDWWKPQGGMAGTGWDSNWRVEIPSGADDAAIADVHFLNWVNAVLPYLSPSDMANLSQQVANALDGLDSKEAVAYFDPLMKNLNMRSMWPTSPGGYWDVDRLRELRRVSNAYWSGMADDGTTADWEPQGRQIANLLDLILGLDTQNVPGMAGIWPEDRPMTRRERQAYHQKVETGLGGMQGDSPYAAILQSMLYPTTSNPRLNAYIQAPTASQRMPTGNQYSYGWSDPRYLGY